MQEQYSSTGRITAVYSRQLTTPVPHHSVSTGQMPFLPPNQQRQTTEDAALKALLRTYPDRIQILLFLVRCASEISDRLYITRDSFTTDTSSSACVLNCQVLTSLETFLQWIVYIVNSYCEVNAQQCCSSVLER